MWLRSELNLCVCGPLQDPPFKEKSCCLSSHVKIITEIDKLFCRRMIRNLFWPALILLASLKGYSQISQTDTLGNATLADCVDYAIKHQPFVQQSLIDEKIAEANIRARLADWFPQVNL